MKVAFDENIPSGMVSVFYTLSKERQFTRLVPNMEIESARDYTPKVEDIDYQAKNDVPWLQRFSEAGGKVIISGDVQMMRVPHERLALHQLGLVTIFFHPTWSNWGFFRKSAMLLNWWPAIAKTIRTARPGTLWAVPLTWKQDGKLKRIPVNSKSINKTNPDRIKTAGDKTKKAKGQPTKTRKNKRQGSLDL